MPAPPELKLLRSVKTGKGLINLIKNLKVNRRLSKLQQIKRLRLSKNQRAEVIAKTAGHCHICGIELNGELQADHVKAHSTGGSHAIDNYLPACNTCNNYRWHYSPEEIQVILKLGVWAKTKICSDAVLGLEMANAFIKHEMGVRKRKRKTESMASPQIPNETRFASKNILGPHPAKR